MTILKKQVEIDPDTFETLNICPDFISKILLCFLMLLSSSVIESDYTKQCCYENQSVSVLADS